MRAVAAILAAALVILGGCGTDEPPEESDTASDSDTGADVAGALDEKPEVTIPDREPPTELLSEDIVTGDGPEAEAGATVTTHYLGLSWSTREEFDSSWDSGEPVTFSLEGVIAGWQEGIPGMRVGGRRLLVIPPDLAYGDQPPPGSGIAPGETLVFVVDLVAVE